MKPQLVGNWLAPCQARLTELELEVRYPSIKTTGKVRNEYSLVAKVAISPAPEVNCPKALVAPAAIESKISRLTSGGKVGTGAGAGIGSAKANRAGTINKTAI